MKRTFLIVICLGLFSLGGNVVNACNCKLIWPKDVPESQFPAMRKVFEDFGGAVFVGKVVKSEKVKVGSEIMRKVTVKVEQRWVGPSDGQIVVYTGISNCDKRHLKGQSYFFFTQQRDGRFDVASCFPSSLDNEVIRSFKLWFAEPKPA